MKNWHICALPLAGTVDLCNRLSSMLSLQTDVISLVKNQLKYNDCSTFVVFHIMVAAILIWQKNTNWWQNSSIMIKDTLMMSIEIFNLCPFLWSLQLLCCDYLSRLRNVFIYCFFNITGFHLFSHSSITYGTVHNQAFGLQWIFNKAIYLS